MKKYLIFVFIAIVLFGARSSFAQKPSDFGLKEGDLISAIFSDDPDVYIINNQGYKRLFLNPEIFKFYGHLGGFFNVKLVTKEVVDAFPTSGLFRDCENGDQKVYGVDTSGEDTGKLHWVNTTGDQAVKDDPDFFKKVFCINSAEFNWYPKGNELNTVKDVPNYQRKEEGSQATTTKKVDVSSEIKNIGKVIICHRPSGNILEENTITIDASAVKAHLAQGDTVGQCLVIYPTPTPSVVISGVSGPQTLNINQQGTWTVTAYNRNGGNLSYSVVWGDEVYAYGTSNSSRGVLVQQSTTFTHDYSQSGTYTPIFTVTNDSGQSAKTSLSVNVGGVTSGSVTLLLPNGGETWTKGTTQTIRWQDSGTTNCQVGSVCAYPTYNITLDQYGPPCTWNICPRYLQRSYTIAKSISGYSYNWSVGKVLDVYGNGDTALDGSYTIQICQTGKNICDSSDSYFKIVSEEKQPNSFSVSPSNATIKVGEATTFQALLDNCPFGVVCFVGPLPVQATWTSSNLKVATVEYKDTCPPGAVCFAKRLDYLTVVVTGVSEGTATITATYTNSSGVVQTANALVTVNSLSGCLGGPVGCVKISSLSPTSGPVGTIVTIYGSGFIKWPNCYPNVCDPVSGLYSNTVNFGNGIIKDIYSYDGTSLTFQVPSSLTPACYFSKPACMIATVITPPGSYNVSVANTNGTSNALNFTVTNLIR